MTSDADARLVLAAFGYRDEGRRDIDRAEVDGVERVDGERRAEMTGATTSA
jgi:hypothetical protein